VNDDGAADDAFRSDQLDELVINRALGVALAVRLDIAEISDVAVLVGWTTVRLAVRVDCKFLR
jgi:hypothetical protein